MHTHTRSRPEKASIAISDDAKTWGLSEDELFMFQECYAIADVACLGYLGQKQFKDLLKLLQIETTAEQLDTMFAQMDENNDNVTQVLFPFVIR